MNFLRRNLSTIAKAGAFFDVDREDRDKLREEREKLREVREERDDHQGEDHEEAGVSPS